MATGQTSAPTTAATASRGRRRRRSRGEPGPTTTPRLARFLGGCGDKRSGAATDEGAARAHRAAATELADDSDGGHSGGRGKPGPTTTPRLARFLDGRSNERPGAATDEGPSDARRRRALRPLRLQHVVFGGSTPPPRAETVLAAVLLPHGGTTSRGPPTRTRRQLAAVSLAQRRHTRCPTNKRRPANPTTKPVTAVARESRASTRLRARPLRAKTRTRRSFKLP